MSDAIKEKEREREWGKTLEGYQREKRETTVYKSADILKLFNYFYASGFNNNKMNFIYWYFGKKIDFLVIWIFV